MQTNNNEMDLSIDYNERTNPNLLQIYLARLVQEGEDCECMNCDAMKWWVEHLQNIPTHRMCNWCSCCMDCDDGCDCDESENDSEDEGEYENDVLVKNGCGLCTMCDEWVQMNRFVGAKMDDLDFVVSQPCFLCRSK